MFAACVCVFSCDFYFEYVFMCVCVVELKYFLVFLLIWLFVHDFFLDVSFCHYFLGFFNFFFIKKGVSYKMNFTNKTISPLSLSLVCVSFACFLLLLIAVNNYVTVTDFLFPSCILENLN